MRELDLAGFAYLKEINMPVKNVARVVATAAAIGYLALNSLAQQEKPKSLGIDMANFQAPKEWLTTPPKTPEVLRTGAFVARNSYTK